MKRLVVSVIMSRRRRFSVCCPSQLVRTHMVQDTMLAQADWATRNVPLIRVRICVPASGRFSGTLSVVVTSIFVQIRPYGDDWIFLGSSCH
jgi:hypothetical protein